MIPMHKFFGKYHNFVEEGFKNDLETFSSSIDGDF